MILILHFNRKIEIKRFICCVHESLFERIFCGALKKQKKKLFHTKCKAKWVREKVFEGREKVRTRKVQTTLNL